jgi:hypothetical protein
MIKPDDNILDYVDDYVQGILPEDEARQVEEYCEKSRVGQVALEEARRRYEALKSLPTSQAGEQLIQSTVEKVQMQVTRRQRTRKIIARTVLLVTAASVLIIGAFHARYYFMVPSPYDLRIMGQEDLLAGSPASLRLTVLNQKTGRPVPNVPLEMTLADSQSGKTVQLVSLTTDETGAASPQFKVPDWPAGRYRLRVTAETGGRAERLIETVHLKREWQLMLSTDKPVYQPGQTIHIRSLALKRPQLKPLIGEKATYSITDPKGNVVFRQTDLTSKYGIASTDCPLATEINEGEYRIECQVGSTMQERTVKVEKYVLPKFKVAITLDKPFYAPGEQVTGSVQADYFFGKPVAGGTVEIDVRETDVQSRVIDTMSATTDSNGKADFDFQLPTRMTGREQDGGDARFTLVASVADTAGQQYARAASRIVTTSPIRLEVIAESGTLVKGVPNTIYVFASYADGRPAEASVIVHGFDQELTTSKLGVACFELTPQDDQVGITAKATDREGRIGRRNVQLVCGSYEGDFLVRTDQAIYAGGDTIGFTALGGGVEPVFIDMIKDGQTMLTTSIEMRDGSGKHEFDLPPELFGTIKLCAYRFGGSGLAVRKTRMIYVNQAQQLSIQATFDADEYRPAARARLKLKLTDDQGNATPGAISLAGVDEAVFSVLGQRPGLEQTFFLLEEELLEPVYVIYPGWSPELFTELPLMQRNDFQRALFAGTSRAAFGIEALPQDFLGSPVAAEASMEEPAPFQPFHDQWQDESPFSLAAASYEDKVRGVNRQRRAGLEGVTVAWFSLIGALAVVGIVLLGVYYPRAFLITSLASLGFVILCCGLPLSVSWVLTGGKAPMQNVDMMLATEDFAIGANGGEGDTREVAPSADVFPMEPDVEMPAEEAGPAPPPRVRKYFPETLLWRPELVTDDQGEVEIEIDLADSITTWRLSTSAVSGEGQLGGAEFPVRVFQPFFVDLNLPVALTRNDEVGVPVVVYNYSDQPQTVELELKDADWFERIRPTGEENADTDAGQETDSAGKNVVTLEVLAGEQRKITFPLMVLKVGVHELEVTARGGDVADAIRREIEVVPDGRRVEAVASGTLDAPFEMELAVPEDAIEGSVVSVVKIYPSTFSQLVEGLDAIFRMPSGCFEQTSSTTYPNVLALDYLRRTKKTVPEVEAKARQYIHVGYQRLISFEVSGGGFDWFGNPPANRTLTAYGLMEFEDMARVHDVDPKLIQRTRRWLLAQRRADGSWPNEAGRLDDGLAGSVNLASTAYIGWAVFGSGEVDRNVAEPTLDFLLAHPPDSIDDPYLVALVANAIAGIDPNSGKLSSYLARLDAIKQISNDGKQMWWQKGEAGRTAFHGGGRAGNIETTAAATLALLKAGQYPGTARGALNWLIAQKDPHGTWFSTQATVLALKALLAGTDTPLGEDAERRVEVAIGGEIVHEFVIPPDQGDVMQQFSLAQLLQPANNYQLRLAEQSPSGAGFQVTFRYHVDEQPTTDPDSQEPLSVDIAYDRQRLQVDETVAATATITNNMDEAAPMVILDLPIPGGFAIQPGELAELVGSQTIARYQITPRKAIVYLRQLEPGAKLELRYRLKATMPVKVAVPDGQAYEYYNPDTRGQGGAAQLEAVQA